MKFLGSGFFIPSQHSGFSVQSFMTGEKREKHKLESFYGNQIHKQPERNRAHVDAGAAEKFSH